MEDDGRIRCGWSRGSALMRDYHDREWGVPERDSRRLWETLMLEGFQAGLSWEIVLRKREGFRAAFARFDPHRVAAFTPADVERLMADPGIVRARAKIEATIRGARIWCDMQARGEDFSAWCWAFVGGAPLGPSGSATQTELSRRISAAMKAKGFGFVGPTIVHAWMQAVGMVNDHAPDCFRAREVAAM